MNEYHDKDDGTLVHLTLLGDKNAFEELVTRYERAVMGIALKVTRNKFSAEDASQDAFVSAWMNLSSLREKEKFKPWVCSIAKNRAISLEAHYRSAIPSISLDEYDYLNIPDIEDEDDFQYDDLCEKVDLLNEKIQEVVKMHYFSNLSIKEIAERLQIKEGTVKWRLSEGRKQLRKGYGIMEKTYKENESVVIRVMRQVEALKLWRIKDNKSGFEAEYKAVLNLVNELPDSKEKSHALADTYLLGVWWIPGKENDKVYSDIKKAAEDGHNEDVMQAVVCYECNKYRGKEKRDFMLDIQIPYLKEKGFLSALGYTWFWLGYEYRCIGQYEKAIEAYENVMNILTPDKEYYANAKSAIYCETKMMNATKRDGFKRVGIHATGEKYRFIDGKLYLWTQPGYSVSKGNDDFSIFWNLSACNNLMYDPNMKVGEVITSDVEKGTLTFLSNSEVCITHAGTFENCLVYVFQGDKYGLTYCKTFLCANVGIVRQDVECYGIKQSIELSKYNIVGGEGIIPFATGNRWDYVTDTTNTAVKYNRDIFFEVTAFKNDVATVAASVYSEISDYFDTFEGYIEKIKHTYCDEINGDEILVDVKNTLQRAKELADTKRQKVHIKVIEDAMSRILDTEPKLNPDYTEKGRWNFYSCIDVDRQKESILWKEKEHFEWKDSAKLGVEGKKMLYSFFDEIIRSCGLGIWSDKWMPGFNVKPKRTLKEFNVLENEAVTTPAGTFENCRHISFVLDMKSYFGGKSDCWYAEGIGIVKYIHLVDENTLAVWHLTEYKGVGEGYYPIADGLYRKYEPDNIGDGYSAALEYTFDSDENGTCIFRNATGNQNRADYEKTMSK